MARIKKEIIFNSQEEFKDWILSKIAMEILNLTYSDKEQIFLKFFIDSYLSSEESVIALQPTLAKEIGVPVGIINKVTKRLLESGFIKEWKVKNVFSFNAEELDRYFPKKGIDSFSLTFIGTLKKNEN